MIAKAIDKINAEQVEKANAGKAAPEFKVGDSVKVFVKIKEGDKERVQAFAGTVIARDNGKGNTPPSRCAASRSASAWRRSSR